MKKNERWLRLLDNHTKMLQQLNRSEHTCINYRKDLEKFFQWLEFQGHRRLEKIRPHDIGHYLDHLEKGVEILKKQSWWQYFFRRRSNRSPLVIRPLSVASRRRHLSSIRQFYEFLREVTPPPKFFWQKKLSNPVRPLLHNISMKDGDSSPTKLLSAEQYQALEQVAVKIETKLALALLYFGGLRLHEVVQLKVDDFHFASGSLHFRRKGGRRHVLRPEQFPLIEKLLLLHLKKRRSASDWVFASKNGQRALTPRAMAMRIEKLKERAQIQGDITPHSFRKGRATELYRKTKDLLFVRDYLNHKDAKVTQTYIDTQSLWAGESRLEHSHNLGHNDDPPVETAP